MPADVLSLAVTQAIADVVGQTERPGLSGSELRTALEQAGITGMPNVGNKRTSLRHVLHNTQVERGNGSALTKFVANAMRPDLYVNDPGRWEQLRAELNAKLVLHGLAVNSEGKLARAPKRAKTLSEAAELAGVMQVELRRRGCHEEVLRHCNEELISQSLFHAVSEAAKSIPVRISSMTQTPGDGAELYDEVLGSRTKPARLTINAMASPSDDSEHKGFKNLLLGIHGHYRNPRAHTTRLGSAEDRTDIYDAFGLFSYVHRRLDSAQLRQSPGRSPGPDPAAIR